MNMLVCVKQVPDTTEIKIDPVTNTLIRAGVPSILNPFDGYALEAAARIKDADPSAKIVVLSMGPEQAKAVLKESLAIAADKAYLVSDGPLVVPTPWPPATSSARPSRRWRSWKASLTSSSAASRPSTATRPRWDRDRGAPELSPGDLRPGGPRWMGTPSR